MYIPWRAWYHAWYMYIHVQLNRERGTVEGRECETEHEASTRLLVGLHGRVDLILVRALPDEVGAGDVDRDEVAAIDVQLVQVHEGDRLGVTRLQLLEGYVAQADRLGHRRTLHPTRRGHTLGTHRRAFKWT